MLIRDISWSKGSMSFPAWTNALLYIFIVQISPLFHVVYSLVVVVPHLLIYRSIYLFICASTLLLFFLLFWLLWHFKNSSREQVRTNQVKNCSNPANHNCYRPSSTLPSARKDIQISEVDKSNVVFFMRWMGVCLFYIYIFFSLSEGWACVYTPLLVMFRSQGWE